jgi:hypothetical protein
MAADCGWPLFWLNAVHFSIAERRGACAAKNPEATAPSAVSTSPKEATQPSTPRSRLQAVLATISNLSGAGRDCQELSSAFMARDHGVRVCNRGVWFASRAGRRRREAYLSRRELVNGHEFGSGRAAKQVKC